MEIGEPSNGARRGDEQPPHIQATEDEQSERRAGLSVDGQDYEPDNQALPTPIDEPMSVPELLQTLLRRTEEAARSTNQRLDEFQNKILALEEAQTRMTPLSAEQSPHQRIHIGNLPYPDVRRYDPTIEQPAEPMINEQADRLQDQEPRISSEPLRSALDQINDQASVIKEMKEEMGRMASRFHNATSSAPEIDRILKQVRSSPFSKRLLAVQLQHTVKIKCPTYNGRADPHKFLTAFGIAMGRTQYSQQEYDAGYCQLFVENLTGDALDWFSKLEPSSIDSFAQLSKVFLKHYSMYIQPAATSADLYTIHQGRNESLRSYIERFKTIASKVAVSDDIVIPALRNGLREDSNLKDDLHINTPQTWEDALHRTNKFAEVEDRRSRPSKQSANQDLRKHENHKGKDSQQQRSKNYPGDDRRIESFNVNSPSRRSEQGNMNARRNRSPNIDASREQAYCEFHRQYGHTTDRCFHFQRLMLKYQNEAPKRDSSTLDHRRPKSPRRIDGGDSRGNPPQSCLITTDSPKRPHEYDPLQLPPPRKKII